jgi:predicted nucleic acid-binding protein
MSSMPVFMWPTPDPRSPIMAKLELCWPGWLPRITRSTYLPEIVLAEIAAAISRGTGQITLALRLAAALRRVPHFQFVPVEQSLGDLAAEIVARYQIRGCDAVYAALAQQQGAILITLDRQQRERLPTHIVARNPAEELARVTG